MATSLFPLDARPPEPIITSSTERIDVPLEALGLSVRPSDRGDPSVRGIVARRVASDPGVPVDLTPADPPPLPY
ncbi:hypothetical protein SKAU_G00035330 [Synaphobranchus kaupii]|uniref:Uncharacterized protein n=1 Tax=Synaphobranchus kaupii TaxID=118154 RepID=A0A9Q1JFT0_SYNKA|nr:hypothetical protein SKAU_G00035330 [Synaphobranchus kaupii]